MSDMTDETVRELWHYAGFMEKVVKTVEPLLQQPAERKDALRYRIAFALWEKLLPLARSIILLTKEGNDVSVAAVARNAQALLALTRVFAESSNKFYYLAIEPDASKELAIRWAYYSLVSIVNYRKLLLTLKKSDVDKEWDEEIKKAGASIRACQEKLLKAGLEAWPPFMELKEEEQRKVRGGATRDDFLAKHFEKIIAQRLNASELKHYRDLGNAAVHSSGIVVFFGKPEEGKPVALFTGATALAVSNASQHLALCALEFVQRCPVLRNLVGDAMIADWEGFTKPLRRETHKVLPSV